MAYRKLSEQLEQLSDPQRSDTFVKLFRAAVRDGTFEAADVLGRFQLPKEYRPRKEGGIQSHVVREMVFEVTPQFERWFEETNASLSQHRRTPRPPRPSLEAFEAGTLDFKALAAQTREQMQGKARRGQQLGQRRAQASKKGRGKAAGRPARGVTNKAHAFESRTKVE